MDPKKKIIIFSVIFGLVTLALISFVIYPLYKGIKKNSEELIVAKRELILSKSETGKFEQFKEIYKELEPNLEKIDRFFIDPEVPINLIKFWEKTAIDSELLISISPAFLKTAETDPWNLMGFQINLTGSFPNFLKFLEKIETSPYLIEVQNLVAKRLTDEDVSVTLLTKVFTK